jgi:hypothetical protein
MAGGIQEHDRSRILDFSWVGYKGKELAALNINIVWRYYRNLMHNSDISKCDRITLNKFVISDMAEASIHHTFPCEEPTYSDFCLCCTSMLWFHVPSLYPWEISLPPTSSLPLVYHLICRGRYIMHWATTHHTQHMRYINYDMVALVPGMAGNTTGIRPMQGLILVPTLQMSQ